MRGGVLQSQIGRAQLVPVVQWYTHTHTHTLHSYLLIAVVFLFVCFVLFVVVFYVGFIYI